MNAHVQKPRDRSPDRDELRRMMSEIMQPPGKEPTYAEGHAQPALDPRPANDASVSVAWAFM